MFPISSRGTLSASSSEAPYLITTTPLPHEATYWPRTVTQSLMRRSSSALPARDACRALWQQQQPQQQRRILSSAAVYPGYPWPASSSSSTASSSSKLLSSSSSASSSSFKSRRTSKLAQPLFAFASAYSTSNPAYPLPGSNNDIDPRGVDYSLFEAEDESYTQYASTSAIVDGTNTVQQDDTSATAAEESTTTLSAPTQLLVRLINSADFEAATTVVQELQTLQVPLNEPLPIYSTAALWAIRHGKKQDLLTWMRLCPGYAPGTKHLETASTNTYPKQVRSIATNFRKCFMILLDSYGDDMRLLQKASMIAAEKGLWSVLQSTLAQILRFGVGRMPDSEATNPALAWQYFNRLVQVHQSQRGLKEEGRKKAILSATVELRGLYNLGIRTLALAGRLDDAIHWADKSVDVNNAGLAQILRLESFTENLLMEELVRAGSFWIDQARSLADRLSSAPARPMMHKWVNVDAVIERIEREAAFTSTETDTDYASRPGSSLDNTILAHLQQGDVVTARDHLLSVLRSATRVRRDDADLLLPYASSSADSTSIFAHLPSARVLSELNDMANKLGTVAVTSSLTETDMHHPESDTLDPTSQETLTAEEFLRPIRDNLLHVRGGKGLWETARLYGFVKKGKYREAVQFYVGKAGFKMPSGGITIELVKLALDQQSLPNPSRRETTDKATGMRGKHWPSTHSINLVLKAIAGVCVEAKDYSRLTQVYNLWKESSRPSRTPSRQDSTVEEIEELVFNQWPPSQRPDSHTFDPFLRAFGRLNVETHPTSPEAKVEKQSFGSSQAMLDIIRDMTEQFSVRPSVSSWTIALECLAREGRARWTGTTSVLARAVGINTCSPLSPSPAEEMVKAAQPSFAPANLATYTALIRALVRVSHSEGGSMVEEVAAIRDDLLLRTLDLDMAVRHFVLAEKEEEGEESDRFYSDLLGRWQAVQRAGLQQDHRERWDASLLLTANQGRTVEALRELWLVESSVRSSEHPSHA
ncbi:uncharacterized protein UTRI_06150_B [Ustilago trichophora]|uniref:Uncharacterized protein n=1 Tax=Ustilago trichophora TaxID=86804 RepID=A0A5C3EJP9_9BASI|nr:uncharacterized protein UTRI_06150_B [Ustilago trichophora]